MTTIYCRVKGMNFTFDSYEMASRRITILKIANDWTEKTYPYPILKTVDGQVLGHVAYNGNVFEGYPDAEDAKRLYPPEPRQV